MNHDGKALTTKLGMLTKEMLKKPVFLQRMMCAMGIFTVALSMLAKVQSQAGTTTAAEAEAKRTAREKILETFKGKADAWRQSGGRVELSGEADRHRILAEAAVSEKNAERAIQHYRAALDLYPTWPSGEFNLALLCGQTGDYDCAVLHMKEYLLLVPDATDARAAYEKIVVWEDKLENPDTSPKGSIVLNPSGECQHVTLDGVLERRKSEEGETRVLVLADHREIVLVPPKGAKLGHKGGKKGASPSQMDATVKGELCGNTLEIEAILPKKTK